MGVFASLVDPLDQSVWFARADGWLHYQPELQIWDEGRVPDAVVTIAFDGDPDDTEKFLLGSREIAAKTDLTV